jgi:hypothetical protein
VNALEPEWEARFEPRSYGFRPGRGCHDAIGAIFNVARGASPRRLWVLDADLAGAFDRIDHSYLLDQLGMFPARGLIADWLKAALDLAHRCEGTDDERQQVAVCRDDHNLSAALEGRVPADLVADLVRAVLDENRRSALDLGVEPSMAEARQRLERFVRARSSA